MNRFAIGPGVLTIDKNDHAVTAIRNHLDAGIFRDVRQDRDLCLEVDDVLQRALRVPEQSRNFDVGMIAPESREDLSGMEGPYRGNAQSAAL